MDNLRMWWEGLEARERQLVSVAGIMVVIGILYWGIWTPISQAEADAMNKLKQQEQTLNYVKQKANKLMSLKRGGGKSSFSGSLSSVVNGTAGRYNLVITRMQPQGDKVQVWMDEVPFESLLGYLNELVQQKGLSLDTLDLSETEDPGLVKVRRIQLSR